MRREIVHFTIQNPNVNFGKNRKLSFDLNNVLSISGLPSHISSFFHTYKGHEAIFFAKKLAKAQLAGSSRNIEVQFKVPLEVGINVDLDTSIILPFFNKSISGKVVEYRLVIDKGQAYVWLRVLSCTKLEEEKGVKNFVKDAYASKNYVEEEVTLLEDFSSQLPKQGIVNLSQIGVCDLVKSIIVQNHADTQIEYLEQNQYPQRLDLKKVLSEIPTVLEVEFLPLKGGDVLEHHIYL